MMNNEITVSRAADIQLDHRRAETSGLGKGFNRVLALGA